MTNKRTHRIAKLRIGEISMVDEGDNPGASVLIMKRRTDLQSDLLAAQEAVDHLYELAAGAGGEEGVEKATRILGEMNMDIDQLNERLEQIDASLTAVTKRAEDAEARADKAEADLATAQAEIEKAKAAGADADADKGDDDEDVLKGLPAPIRKRLLDAEAAAAAATAAIEKSRDDADLTVQVTKARDLGVADAEEIGALLHRVAKGKSTAEDAAKVVEVLTIAKNVKDADSKLFKSIGDATTGGKSDDGADAQAQLDEAITAIQKAKPTITREQAYAEAIEANPALYDEIAKRKA